MLQTNQSCRRPLSTLSTIASRKYTSLKQVIGINTIHDNKKNLSKLKIIIINQIVSCVIQNVAFAVNN